MLLRCFRYLLSPPQAKCKADGALTGEIITRKIKEESVSQLRFANRGWAGEQSLFYKFMHTARPPRRHDSRLRLSHERNKTKQNKKNKNKKNKKKQTNKKALRSRARRDHPRAAHHQGDGRCTAVAGHQKEFFFVFRRLVAACLSNYRSDALRLLAGRNVLEGCARSRS